MKWSCDRPHLHCSDVIPAGSSWFQAHGLALAEADSVITAVVVSVRRRGFYSDVFSLGILFGWHVFLAAVTTPWQPRLPFFLNTLNYQYEKRHTEKIFASNAKNYVRKKCVGWQWASAAFCCFLRAGLTVVCRILFWRRELSSSWRISPGRLLVCWMIKLCGAGLPEGTHLEMSSKKHPRLAKLSRSFGWDEGLLPLCVCVCESNNY